MNLGTNVRKATIIAQAFADLDGKPRYVNVRDGRYDLSDDPSPGDTTRIDPRPDPTPERVVIWSCGDVVVRHGDVLEMASCDSWTNANYIKCREDAIKAVILAHTRPLGFRIVPPPEGP